METQLQHIQFNVRPENLAFYKGLLTFLGWQTLHEDEGMLGVADKNNLSLWFVGYVKDVVNDYDGPGMNHLALGTMTQADVDTAATYLREQGVELLFETPRHRPDFSNGDDQTYYQVMFTSPDKILIEVVYTGPKG
jgi:catechol 2,3-dioxygenase-like lactoylglutathione lyase family enzyme